MSRLHHCYNIADLRAEALKRLPKGVFQYIDRGAEDEVALADNRQVFRDLKLRTKFMVDLTDRDMGIDLLGKRSELPMAIAPTGVAGLAWFQGELALQQLFFLRPAARWAGYRTPISGYYQCGASTHPGGGDMGAAGRRAAQQILADE